MCDDRAIMATMLRLLLLDLDNTLYSDTVGMEHEIMFRMNHYVAKFLNLDLSEAIELRRDRSRRFGTTLEWLMTEHGHKDAELFFSVVHPAGEESIISRDPGLRRLLESIGLPKVIFTNSPMEHATRVLAKLGVADLFGGIYDIRFNKLRGKPHADAILRVCDACGVLPEETLLVDDLPKYVKGHIDVGGQAVLLDERDRHADQPFRRIRGLPELPGLIAALSAGATLPALS